MTDKLYLITEAQRDQITTKIVRNTSGIEVLDMLQSLPMVTDEPVAEFCGTNSEDLHIAELNGTWKFIKIGSKLYTSPQALTPISADDVTKMMISEYFSKALATFHPKDFISAAYNAVIKHRSEA